MSDMNLLIEEELLIILLKKYELNAHIKGYYAYMMKWNPTLKQSLTAPLERENDVVVGHLSKGKAARFAQQISFFHSRKQENS